MLYILNYSFSPNSAVSNRMIGYLKAMDKMGVDATFIVMMPDVSFSKLNLRFKHIKVEYLWESMKINHRLLRPVYYRLFCRSIRKRLRSGDKVYTYGFNALSIIGLNVKGVECFCERTEHPDVVSAPASRLVVVKRKDVLPSLKAMKGIFVISSPLRDYFIEQGMNADKVHVINMTVDATRFEGIKKQQVKERYIAYCGTASNNKDGVDELIKAFAIVAEKIKDIKLYIIGRTPSPKDEAGNIALIERLGLRERIAFQGLIPADKMPQLLKNADVVALDRPDSLQAKHGFPTKLGEYLLTQNPVVVTKVGDIPKFLTDGETALLSEERNAPEFASKLIWALEHPVEAEEIGRRGSQVALREFNSEIETRKMIDIIFSK